MAEQHVSTLDLQGGGDDEKRENQRENRRQNDENSSDQNLVRLHRGLRTAVTPALKTLFKKLWDDENQEQPWGWTESDVKTLTNKVDKKRKYKLNSKFDEHWKTCNKWDISKLGLAIIDCKVLKRIKEDGELSGHIKGLRDIRNKEAHETISDKDFQREMQNMIDNLTFLEIIIDVKPYVKILIDLKQEHEKEQNFKERLQGMSPPDAFCSEILRSVSVICDKYKAAVCNNQTPTTCSENDKFLQSDSPEKNTNKDLSPVGQSFPVPMDSDAYSDTMSTQTTDVVHSSKHTVNNLEVNDRVFRNSWRSPMIKVPFGDNYSNSSNFTETMLNAANEAASRCDSSSVLYQSLFGSHKYSDRNIFPGNKKLEQQKHTITSQEKMYLNKNALARVKTQSKVVNSKGSFELDIRQENTKNINVKIISALGVTEKQLHLIQPFYTGKLQRGQPDGLECEIEDNTDKLQRGQPDGLECEIEDVQFEKESCAIALDLSFENRYRKRVNLLPVKPSQATLYYEYPDMILSYEYIDTCAAHKQNVEKTDLPNDAKIKELRNNFENRPNELALSMQKQELIIRQLQTENRKLKEEQKELRVKLGKEDLDKRQIKDEIVQLKKELKDFKEVVEQNEKENASLLEQQQSHIEQMTEELKNTKLDNIHWQDKAGKTKKVQDKESGEKPGDENIKNGDDEFCDEGLSEKKQTAQQSSKQRETKLLQMVSVEDGAVGGETYDEVLMTVEKATQGQQNCEHGEKMTFEKMKLEHRSTIVKILGRELKATQEEKNREHGENMTVEKMKLEHRSIIVKILGMELESLSS